jgi:hypothetical protein
MGTVHNEGGPWWSRNPGVVGMAACGRRGRQSGDGRLAGGPPRRVGPSRRKKKMRKRKRGRRVGPAQGGT